MRHADQRTAAETLRMLILLLVTTTCTVEGVIPCSLSDTTLLSSDMIMSSCTSVVLSNVTFHGVGTFANMSIGGILLANPTSPIITLSLLNCIVSGGAVVFIDGIVRGTMATMPVMPAVSTNILIQSLRGLNGAIVFRGSFPRHTSIIMTSTNMTADSQAIAPTLPSLDPYNATSAKMVMLVDLALVDNSSWTMQNSSLTVIGQVSWYAMFVTGSLVIANESALVMLNIMLSSSFVTFFATHANISVTKSSKWMVGNSSFLATATDAAPAGQDLTYDAFYVSLSSVVISDSSQWLFNNCSFSAARTAPGSAVYAYGFDLTLSTLIVQDHSTWAFASCIMDTRTQISSSVCSSLYLRSNITVQRHSEWRMVTCIFSSSCLSGTSIAANIDHESLVVISDNSSWGWIACSMSVTAAGMFCSSFLAGNLFSPQELNQLSVVISDMSVWSFVRCTILSQSLSLSTTSFAEGWLAIGATIWIANRSSFLFSRNNFVAVGMANAYALDFTNSPITVSDASLFSISSCAITAVSASGAGDLGAFALYCRSNVTIADSSEWSWSSSNFSSSCPKGTDSYGLFFGTHSKSSSSASSSAYPIAIVANSSWTIDKSQVFVSTTSKAAIAIHFLSSSVLIDGGSLFSFTNLTISAKHESTIKTDSFYSEAFFVFLSSVIVSNTSMFILRNLVISSLANVDAYGIDFTKSRVTVTHGSSLVMQTVSCGVAARQFATNGAYGMYVSSFISISDKSLWIMKEVMYQSVAYVSTNPGTGIFFDKGTTIVLDEGSCWMFVSNTLFCGGSPMLVSSRGAVSIGNASWFLFASNSLTAVSSDTCVRFEGMLLITQSGTLSYVENSCTSLGSMWANLTTSTLVTGPGRFYTRCNTLNKSASVDDGIPPTAVSAGSCKRCSVVADCYAPLTTLNSTCLINTSNGYPVCSCLADGQGDRCTPVFKKYSQDTKTTSISQSEHKSTLTRTEATMSSSGGTSPTVLRTTTYSKISTPISISSSASANNTLSRAGLSSSVSATISESCPPHPAITASNTTLALDMSQKQRFVAGSSMTMAQLSSGSSSGATTTLLTVAIYPAPGVVFTRAGNVSASVGSDWHVSSSEATRWNEAYISIEGDLRRSDMAAMTLLAPSRLVLSLSVGASGRCLPPNYRGIVQFSWTILPPPATTLNAATQTTFRASATASSFAGSPVTAMATTGMISLLQMSSSCLFSDVDPLESSVSPLGEIAVGPEIGQYYRGAAIVALLLYVGIVACACGLAFVISRASHRMTSVQEGLALLRFPSVGMVVVSLFGQGLASVGVSLIRLGGGAEDLALGLASLVACIGLVVWAGYTTTAGLRCRQAPQVLSTSIPPAVRTLLRYTTWRLHWEDCRGSMQFKRRHLMLIDDLSRPWWAAVEMSSAVIQGSILGIRLNDLQVCRGQQWVLLVHCTAMLGAAAFFRPCGALLSNFFLVVSKATSTGIILCQLLSSLTLNVAFASAAEVVAAASTIVASLQTLMLVVNAVVLLALMLPSLRKNFASLFTRKRDGEEPGRAGEKERSNLRDLPPVRNDATHLQTAKHRVVRLNDLSSGSLQQQRVMRCVYSALSPSAPRHVRLQLLVEAAAASARSTPS